MSAAGSALGNFVDAAGATDGLVSLGPQHEVPAQSATAWSGVPSTDLVAGEVGTVVMVYTNDSIHYEYEVEFVDADGQTRGLLSLKEDEIEPVKRHQSKKERK